MERSISPRQQWPRTTVAIALLGGLVIGGAAVHLAIDAAVQAAPWMNNDTALLMFIAQEMDGGARLYIDWIDPDPPSIFLVMLAAVRAARVGIPVALAYDLIVLLLAAAGLAVLVASLRRLDSSRAATVLAAGAYLLFVLKPGPLTGDFGQREHLFALMFVPELFALSWARGRRWRIPWCGGLAFLAMMKPQFVVMLGAVELAAARGGRPTRGEVAAFAAGTIAPLALLWLHSAESFRAMFTEGLALHLSGTYALLSASPTALLARGPLIVMGLAIAAGAALAVLATSRPRLRRLAGSAGLALVLALAAVVHQQKYFPYHFTPLFGVAVVVGAWAVGELLRGRRAEPAAPLLAGLMLATGMAVFHFEVARNDAPLEVRLGRSVDGTSRLLVVSVYSHGLCTPFAEAPRCVGPRPFEPTLPRLAAASDRDSAMAPLVTSIRERLRERRPELIAISSTTTLMPEGVTPASLLLEDYPVFEAGEYVPFSDAALERVRARGWMLLRRHDVSERRR